MEKVKEEMNEFYTEAESGNVQGMQAEFGDLLFSLVNYARVMELTLKNHWNEPIKNSLIVSVLWKIE
jgi:uncharacterized protein YabN with tetrapyrrole methylase and pyrophosphatase domain